jgi:hypothetical protein
MQIAIPSELKTEMHPTHHNRDTPLTESFRMSTLKTAAVATACVAGSFLLPSQASAFTLISNLSGGSPTPIPNAAVGTTLQSGDFTLLQQRPSIDRLLGNGLDEATQGVFDFSSQLTNISALTTARLSITLTPQGQRFDTDAFRFLIPGLDRSFIDTPFDGLAIGQTQTVEIDLFDFFPRSQRLINAFNSVGGVMAWEYGDDAIISSAQLILSDGNDPVSTPEPTTVLGLLAGAAMLGRKRQHA